MSNKNSPQKGAILYKVDPKRLSVMQHQIRYQDSDEYDVTTTHDFFAVDLDRDLEHIDFSSDNYPIESKGLLYFKNEDEAHNFIKNQIGL